MKTFRFLRATLTRLGGLFHRNRSERELSAELQSHLQFHIEDNLRRGMSVDQARREAVMKLGGVEQTKEMYRERRGLPMLETFWQDIRFGARMLRKSPGFTAAAVLTLALGIGANTAIFSVANAVLLRPLAIARPDRVMLVQERWQELPGGVSVGNFVDWREESRTFEELGALQVASFNLATADAPERISGGRVTAAFFPVFGVRPLLGRTFRADEDQSGGAQVAVIGENLWRTHFQSGPGILGRTIQIDGRPHIVVGVMPKSFDPILNQDELWVPIGFTAAQIAQHDEHFLIGFGRLKQGVSQQQAQSEMDVIAQRQQQRYPVDNKGRGIYLTPLTEGLVGTYRKTLWLLLGAAGFVLLIACANIANLQLARARRREKEIAVRAALGAGAWRIMRQLLSESLVLSALSAAAGVALAYWGVPMLIAHGPSGVPRLAEAGVDIKALAFTCTVAIVAGFLFGFAPALRSARLDLNEAFKQGAGTTRGGARDTVRSGIVVSQVALAMILLIGSGLLLRSALLLRRVDFGLDTANLLIGRVGLPAGEYGQPAVARSTFERLVEQVSALPGVSAAAVVSRAPLSGGGTNGLVPEGRPVDPSSVIPSRFRLVSPGYFQTARVPLHQGRTLSVRDESNAPKVMVINETLARSAWPGQNPIGKRMACCEPGPDGGPMWHEVVGVAGDVRAAGLDQQPQPEFYLPVAQAPAASWSWIQHTMDVVVRAKESGAVSVGDLRNAVQTVAPGVPIYGVSSMQERIASSLEQSHFDTFLFAVFGVTSLLLASAGIYGVVSYAVTQRTREIGIRMALGAEQGDVSRLVLGHGLRLTAIGAAIGLVVAAFAGRAMSGLLFGVKATDPLTFAVVSVSLVIIAGVASYLPARRAARIDPLVALKYE